MKNTIIIFIVLLSPIFLMAQSQKSINSFYKKYMQYENMTNVNLQGWVLQMASNYVDEEKEKEILNKITKLRVMVMEESNLIKKEDVSQLKSDVKKEEYYELMQINEGKSKIDFYIRQMGDEITDVLVLVNDEDSFVLLSLEGNFKFSDLNDLQFDVEGADYLKKLPDDRKKLPRA